MYCRLGPGAFLQQFSLLIDPPLLLFQNLLHVDEMGRLEGAFVLGQHPLDVVAVRYGQLAYLQEGCLLALLSMGANLMVAVLEVAGSSEAPTPAAELVESPIIAKVRLGLVRACRIAYSLQGPKVR